MATRGIAHDVKFLAWDTSANAGKTGDAANITMRWIKTTTAAALTTTTVTEVDSTNCPGVYRVALSATETDTDIGTLAGKSSTANISIIPVTIQFERLPDAAPTAAGGVLDTTRINGVAASSVTTINANIGTTQPVNFTGTGASALAKSDMVDIAGAAVSTSAAQIGVNAVNIGGTAQTGGDIYSYLTTNLGLLGVNLSAIPKTGFKLASDGLASVTAWTVAITGNITGNLSGSVGSVTGNVGGNVTGSVGSVTSGVTVTTNNDKTGYSLSSAGVQAIWDAATSALTTLGSIGKWILDKLDVVVSTRLGSSSYTAPLDAAGTRSAVGLASANLDAQLDALPTAAENRAEMDANSTKLASINTATGTTIPALIGTPAGASIAADIATNLAKWTTAVTESYAADGSAPTPEQALMMILQSLHEFAISGTTRTVKKLDGSTTAMTFTLDDATNPTSTTRAT